MWVIAVPVGLAILLLFVLCVPLDATLDARVHGRLRFRVRLSWLFGLVQKEITGDKKKPEKKPEIAKGKRKHDWRRSKGIFEIIRTKGLLKQLRGLIKSVLSRLTIRGFVANLKIGLEDPADTGFLFAIIGPAVHFLGSSHFREIKVQPSFGGEAVFESFSYGRVRLRPIQLLTPFLRFAFSLATIRVVKKLVLTKWKRKK